MIGAAEIQRTAGRSHIDPNSAGKTTLFNIITGFLPADSGHFIFKNKDILHLPTHRIVCKGIARTFQNLRLLRQITVLGNILFCRLNQVGESPLSAWIKDKKYWAGQKQNREKAESILEFIGLADKRQDLAAALSYGQ